MDIRYVILAASLPVGLFLTFLGGLTLAVIFALLWIDKILIEAIKFPRIFGVEFVTVSMIAIGIVHGYWIGFLFALIIIPVLEGIRQLFIPKNEEWPPFVPSLSHVADGIVALIAFSFRSTPLAFVFIASLIVKYIINSLKDKILFDKPPDPITPVTNFIFNIALVLFLSPLIEMLMVL
jgi:hypothetical protein